MTEANLKTILVQLARAQMKSFVVIRHEDRFTHGIPDITFTGMKLTTWIEVKHATPGFQSKGIQELTMLRLGVASSAYYVVYWEKKLVRRTYIVEPSEIGKSWEEWTRYTDGFNHQWVLDFIKGVHHDNIRP